MSLATLFAALAAMAVNFGWQKADDGYEYLVQLEPETVQLLNEGVDVPIDSHVPAGIQPIRKVRIVVGRAELPHDDLTASHDRVRDDRIERTTFFRPGETTPPVADGRYGQPPSTGQPSAIDRIVEPIRAVDDFVERGFEGSVDGLERTGNAIRSFGDNTANTVKDQLQRGKEILVGPTPDSAYRGANPAGTTPTRTAAPPAVASASGWPVDSAAPAAGNTGSIPGLPPPPLNESQTPAESTPATTTGPSGWDPRGSAFTPNGGDSRMVPIESANTTTEPEASSWQPNAWPPVQANPASNPDWIKNSPPTNSTNPSSTSEAFPPTSPTTIESTSAKIPTNSSDSDDSKAREDATSAKEPQLGWVLVGTAIMFGSIGLNFFLGFNYLDIRNKYRAALRRTSRGFSRPAASA